MGLSISEKVLKAAKARTALEEFTPFMQLAYYLYPMEAIDKHELATIITDIVMENTLSCEEECKLAAEYIDSIQGLDKHDFKNVLEISNAQSNT